MTLTRRILCGATASLALAVAAPAAAQPLAPPLQFSGEVRYRGELDRRTPDTPDRDGGFDAVSLLRTRLGLRVPVSSAVRVFIQLQDARAFGEETNTLTDATADRFDLHQGYIELADSLAGYPLLARLGRQEIALGDERLIGVVGWSNTGRSFDGLRLQVGALNAFATQIREQDAVLPIGVDPRANEGEDRDHSFFGLYLDARPGDLYLLHDRQATGVNLGAGTGTGAVSDVDRTTFGGRLELPTTPLRPLFFEAEAVYQFGNQRTSFGPALRAQDIDAWMAIGRLGIAAPTPGPFRGARLGLDWLSGDDDLADDRYGAFNTLYATNHKFYGFMDLYLDPARDTGGRGLVDGLVGVTLGLTPQLALDATLHRFWTATARSVAAPGGGFTEDRDLGWELDLTLPFPVRPGLGGLAGYSLYRTGEAAPLAGLGTESGDLLHWAYLQLQVNF